MSTSTFEKGHPLFLPDVISKNMDSSSLTSKNTARADGSALAVVFVFQPCRNVKYKRRGFHSLCLLTGSPQAKS